jgi:altronate dehydratase small subunit
MEAKRALAMTPKDNVAVALENILPADEVAIQVKGGKVRSIRALESIPFGFKIALENLPKGGSIYKYGETIGRATQNIKTGEQVHIHNIQGVRVQG